MYWRNNFLSGNVLQPLNVFLLLLTERKRLSTSEMFQLPRKHTDHYSSKSWSGNHIVTYLH